MNKEELNDIVCQSSSDYEILDNAYDYIEKLQQENKKYKEVIDNIKYYLEDSANQMSEDSTYTLMDFIREVE